MRLFGCLVFVALLVAWIAVEMAIVSDDCKYGNGDRLDDKEE